MNSQLDILLVDDSLRKIERIHELIKRILPDVNAVVTQATDASTAARQLREKRFDLLVLDINLPLRSGEGPRRDGGLGVLRMIRTRKGYHRPLHIVGISAYADLVARFAEEFADEMWYLIPYDETSDEWSRQFAQKLVHLADSLIPSPTGAYEYDLAVLTALHKIELEAILDLDGQWERHEWSGDTTVYFHGRFNRADGCYLSVVAAAATEMGMPAATALSMKMISRYRPRYLAMAGIAAGVKGHFGDILVADQSWDYGAGKAKPAQEGQSIFLPAPAAIPLSPHLKARFEAFGLNKKVLREIQLRWEDEHGLDAPLQAHIGPVASGAAVLENRVMIDEIVARNRKLIGVEMETYGVFVAARQSVAPSPDVMSIKSICDFGDERKDDEYQRYAAFTSAQYLYEFALAELVLASK